MELFDAAIVAIAVFTIPGFLLNAASGLKTPWAAAASVPSSFALYGLAGWFYGMINVRYNVPSVAILWIVLMVLAVIWRRVFARRARRRRMYPSGPVARRERKQRAWRRKKRGSAADPTPAASSEAPAQEQPNDAPAEPADDAPEAQRAASDVEETPQKRGAERGSDVETPKAEGRSVRYSEYLAAASAAPQAGRLVKYSDYLKAQEAASKRPERAAEPEPAAEPQPESTAQRAEQQPKPVRVDAAEDTADAAGDDGAAARASTELSDAATAKAELEEIRYSSVRASDWLSRNDPELTSRWAEGFFSLRWILPALGAIAGMSVLICRGMWLVGHTRYGLRNIFQGWDSHWHASVVEYIDDVGIASPTRMGELQNIETGKTMYYPTAWHSGAWLVRAIGGYTPIEALNITSVVLPGILLPLTAALIAWRLVGNRGMVAQCGAALAGLGIALAPVLFWIGYYVGAWPYLASIGMCGIVIALMMSLPAAPARGFAAALAFIGTVQTHPSAATIIVLALACWWLLGALWRPARPGHKFSTSLKARIRDAWILFAIGGLGALILLPQILVGSSQSEEVAAVTDQAHVSRGQAWWDVIAMHTRHTDQFLDHQLVLWLAAFGGIALLLWRRNVWAPVFWILSVAIAVNSIVPWTGWWGSTLGFIGALHYNSAHRLVMPVAIFTYAAAAVGGAIIIRLVTFGFLKRGKAITALLAAVVTLATGHWLTAYINQETEKSSAFAIAASRVERLVSTDDRRAFDWLAKQPHAYEGNILSNPAEGSGWMYAYNGLPALFNHYLFPQVDDHDATGMLYWHPNYLGVGNDDDRKMKNDADLAAEHLGVRYIYVSPPNFWADQPEHDVMTKGLPLTPGVTPVYKEGDVTIYAVNAQFTDEELTRMRQPGQSPEPLPPVETRGDAGVAESASDVDKPYYHRFTRTDEGKLQGYHTTPVRS